LAPATWSTSIEPINVARAAVIDEDALYSALEEGHLGGAALDVWWQYPTPAEPSRRPSRYPFHEPPNVLMITSHSSSTTEATTDRRWWSAVAANLDRFVRGEQLYNIVLQTRETKGPTAALWPPRQGKPDAA
jgi:phosphoglycerate dehydrogenase-like enzyme